MVKKIVKLKLSFPFIYFDWCVELIFYLFKKFLILICIIGIDKFHAG